MVRPTVADILDEVDACVHGPDGYLSNCGCGGRHDESLHDDSLLESGVAGLDLVVDSARGGDHEGRGAGQSRSDDGETHFDNFSRIVLGDFCTIGTPFGVGR